MARDGRRRQPDALSRAALGAIEITKATLCPERNVAFFVAPRGRSFRVPCVRFESGERVCCASVRPRKKVEFAENSLDTGRFWWYNYNELQAGVKEYHNLGCHYNAFSVIP